MTIVWYDEDGNEHQKTWQEGLKELAERHAAALRGEVSWGPWKYNPSNQCLEAPAGNDVYQIALTECTTSAEVLDWIIQIAEKQWGDDATVAGLVRAINELLHPQATMCSMGIERGPVAVKELLKP